MPTREEKLAEIERLRKIQEIEALRKRPEDKTSPGVAAALGASQGLSFGFGDEIAGAAKAGYDTVFGEDKFSDLPDTYRRERDVERQRLSKAEKDQPGAYLGGNIAGSVGSAFIPGVGQAMLPVKGASLGANLLRAGAAGAVTGLGASQADLTKGEVGKATEDTFIGGLTGAGTAGAFNAAGKVASKFTPEMLKKMAAERAAKAATGQNVSALRKMARITGQGAGSAERAERNLQNVGQEILDSGAVKFGSKVEDIAPRLAKAKEAAGKTIGDIGSKIDEIAPNAVDAKKIAAELSEYAASIPKTAQGQKLADRIMEEAAALESMKGISFKDAQTIKNQFKYKPQDADALISNQDVTNKINSIIGKNMDETAAKIAETGDDATKALLGSYQQAKGKYGALRQASDASTDRAVKNLSNRWVSPSDYGVGGAALAGTIASGGTALPAVATAAAVAGANKVLRERGNAAAAVGLQKAAKLMESSPEFVKQFGNALIDAGKRGPAALAVTHQLLLKNPEYRRQMNE